MIIGDGETSRGFNYVAAALQANLLATTANTHRRCEERSYPAVQSPLSGVYNLAVVDRTTINDL